MTSATRAKLRGMANTLEPILHIGKEGITENIVTQADEALEARELIKGTVQKDVDKRQPLRFATAAVLHNAMFAYANVNALSINKVVKKGELGRFIEGVKDLDIDGFDITMPHKQDVIPFLDAVSYTHLDVYKRQVICCFAGSRHGRSGRPG